MPDRAFTFYEDVTRDGDKRRIETAYQIGDTLPRLAVRLYGESGDEVAYCAVRRDAGDDFKSICRNILLCLNAYQEMLDVYKTQDDDKTRLALAKYTLAYNLLKLSIEAQTKSALDRQIATFFIEKHDSLAECVEKYDKAFREGFQQEE